MSRRYCAIWASLAVAVAPTPYPTNGPPLNRQPSQQPQRFSSRDPRSCSPARSVAAGCRFHVGGKRVAVGSPWKGGLDHEFAVNPDSHSADVVVTAQITQGGTMRQTEQERLIDLEAKHTFQTQTLRTIRVVAELEGEAFVVVFEEGDGLLEVVPALDRDAELVVLDLRLDLEAGLADGLGERLGLVLGDPLDERALNAVGAAAGGLGLAALQGLERDLAPHELVLEDVQGGLGALVGLRGDRDTVAGPLDRSAGVLEVEPLGQLLLGLVQGVVDFLAVDVGDDVERGISHSKRILSEL